MRLFVRSIAVTVASMFCVCACSDLDLDESQYHTRKYQFSNFDKVKEVMTNVYGYLESGFYNFRNVRRTTRLRQFPGCAEAVLRW